MILTTIYAIAHCLSLAAIQPQDPFLSHSFSQDLCCDALTPENQRITLFPNDPCRTYKPGCPNPLTDPIFPFDIVPGRVPYPLDGSANFSLN